MPIGEHGETFEVSGARRVSGDSGRSDARSESLEEAGRYIGAKKSHPEYRKSKGFWPRILKHFKRFWLCYGIAGFIFLAIFLPLFFLVILPAIAQRVADDAKIPIHSVEVLEPTPEGITFSLAASLNVPLNLGVRTDPFNLSLFDREVEPRKPYLDVPLESLRLKGKSDITITNQTVQIRDQEEFSRFLEKAVYSKKFVLSAYGKTTAHLGALKIPLELNKDIELDGLDRLSGFSIDSASLALPPKEDGSNLVGQATIPNYSLVTFALGNVTLNLKIDDLILGSGTINNILLRPGNNTIPLRGELDIATAIQNIGPILAAQANPLSNLQLMLQASGNSTIYNGRHIPYFERVLNNLTVTANVPVLEVLVGSLGELISSNPDAIQNVTDVLRETDLSTGPNM